MVFCIFLITLEIFASPLVHTDLPYEHHGLIMVIELSRVHCGLKSNGLISKLNKHAAWVWFEITSIISDQNCLTQIYNHYMYFIASIMNCKIQLLKYRIFVVIRLKYFIDLVLSWFIKLKNCVSFSSNLIGLCEQALKYDWLLCFNRGF